MKLFPFSGCRWPLQKMGHEHFEGNTSLRMNHIYLQFISWILRAAETNWDCSDSHLGQNSHSLQHRLRLSVPISFFLQFIPSKGQKEEQSKRSNWKKQVPVVYNLKALWTHRYRGSPKWKKCIAGDTKEWGKDGSIPACNGGDAR